MFQSIFRTLSNCFKIPELKSRILFTVLILAICRVTSLIPCPGLDGAALTRYFNSGAASNSAAGGLFGMASMFTGGGFEHCAIGALSIMPYISATIILQLLQAVIPFLSKKAREEGGRTWLIQAGRVLTVFLCLGQAIFMVVAWEHAESVFPEFQGPAGHDAPDLVVSHPDHSHSHHRHRPLDVAGRTNHRPRHWQRHFVDHHRRHPGASARRRPGSV